MIGCLILRSRTSRVHNLIIRHFLNIKSLCSHQGSNSSANTIHSPQAEYNTPPRFGPIAELTTSHSPGRVVIETKALQYHIVRCGASRSLKNPSAPVPVPTLHPYGYRPAALTRARGQGNMSARRDKDQNRRECRY